MKARSERGAVAIEAALSLVLFMFAMLTVYSMYNICLAQARINTALNETAKEISQFSYVYSMTGLNDMQSNLANKGGAAESVLSDNLSEVNTVYDAIMGVANTAFSIGDDADSFAAYTLNQGVEWAKGGLVGLMARGLMKKHFGEDADAYLRRLGVVDGVNGLDMSKTRLFVDGQGDEIMLDVRYDIKVIELLDVDITFSFEHCAKTKAWMA